MSIAAGTFLERHTKKLSFAVYLLDDYSKSAPIGRVEVFLNDGERAVKNASSHYYKFLELPKGEYGVQVRSANYFDETSEPVNTLTYNNKNPINVKLVPRPSYPFAPGETLVRGLLLGGDGKPIPGGRLSGKAANKDFSSRTTENGEFVIYFGTLAEEDVVEEDGRYFVKGDTDAKINISIDYGGASKVTELDEVEVGKTRSITISLNSS
jgi:hypothetical protein